MPRDTGLLTALVSAPDAVDRREYLGSDIEDARPRLRLVVPRSRKWRHAAARYCGYVRYLRYLRHLR